MFKVMLTFLAMSLSYGCVTTPEPPPDCNTEYRETLEAHVKAGREVVERMTFPDGAMATILANPERSMAYIEIYAPTTSPHLEKNRAGYKSKGFCTFDGVTYEHLYREQSMENAGEEA